MDKFQSDVWEEWNTSKKILSIQCQDCGKMVKHFFINRRRGFENRLIINVKCAECYSGYLKPNKN
jgi:endogenous inhibitor of DNA gyrase (YacG/DUF329 family)